MIDVSKLASDFSGHGGGDTQLVKEFMDYLRSETAPSGITTLDRSLESHYAALAAEESRLDGGKPVVIEAIKQQ